MVRIIKDHNGHDDMHEMSEAEFINEMKEALLILTTSSADKRDIYRLLFSSHAKDDNHYAGLNCFFTDGGALGKAPSKTAEKTNDYSGNLKEKAFEQMLLLKDPAVRRNIRSQLSEYKNIFDRGSVNIIGMTEDSGWHLEFENQETQKAFVDIIIRDLKEKLKLREEHRLPQYRQDGKQSRNREDTEYLMEKLHETSFPGPNLKPLQEHLEGGFNEMMTMIYNAADELGIKNLRFVNSTNVCFVSPNGKYFPVEFQSKGRLLTRKEYEQRLTQTQKGEAINSNFVHVPDGQADGEQKTIDMLIRTGLHTKSSSDLPADYARRELTEYLQHPERIGKRRSVGPNDGHHHDTVERDRTVNLAIIDPETMDKKGAVAYIPANFNIYDLKSVKVPTRAELLENPHRKILGDADVILLMPSAHKRDGKRRRKASKEAQDHSFQHKPNLDMLLDFVVTHETDPESMGIPIIVDNRTGQFNKALELIRDAFAQGRLMGEPPFTVVHDDKQLYKTLTVIKDVKQRAPVIESLRDSIPQPEVKKIPNDGKFTVFVGGGHNNNATAYMQTAEDFGYYCAEHGWRIVTGAGSVEGSMGGIHTGFIQYHLDQLQQRTGDLQLSGLLGMLNEFRVSTAESNGHAGKLDAKRAVEEHPEVIEKLADKGYIPRGMFFGYSMEPLLEMESPSKKKPPGITYFESGNMQRRLGGLLAPGTKVFLPGGFGTYQEFVKTVKQHLWARLRKEKEGYANDVAFADGTRDDDGMMIVYNHNGQLNTLLQHYGLMGNNANADPVTAARLKENNIVIVISPEELQDMSEKRWETWKQKIPWREREQHRKEQQAADELARSA